MIIELSECEGTDGHVFEVLYKYSSIDGLIMGLISQKASWCPRWLNVRWGSKNHVFVKDDIVSEDSKEMLREMKRLPKERRLLPNETMRMDINVGKREWVIWLDNY